MMLREGDIVLIRSRWWLRWLCEYDHAALVWSRQPRLEGEVRHFYSLEAGFSGVRAYRYGHWPREWIVLRPACDIRVSYDAVTQAMRWLGDPYAIWHLPAVFRRMWTNRRQIRTSTDKLRVCTELCRDAYLSVGLDLTPGIARPSPDDIFYSEFVEFVGSSDNMEVIE
jgi:hypothetical protein